MVDSASVSYYDVRFTDGTYQRVTTEADGSHIAEVWDGSNKFGWNKLDIVWGADNHEKFENTIFDNGSFSADSYVTSNVQIATSGGLTRTYSYSFSEVNTDRHENVIDSEFYAPGSNIGLSDQSGLYGNVRDVMQTVAGDVSVRTNDNDGISTIEGYTPIGNYYVDNNYGDPNTGFRDATNNNSSPSGVSSNSGVFGFRTSLTNDTSTFLDGFVGSDGAFGLIGGLSFGF